MATFRSDLRALRTLIAQAERTLPAKLPEGRGERCRELLRSAVALADHLLAMKSTPAAASAASLGQKGGMRTAERGPEYFRQIAAMRKTRGGGRPRKES